MIRKLLVYVAVCSLLALGGCSSMSPTDKGVLGGGAIGAGTGAVVGNALGNTGAGALVGGAVGALSGGLVGNEIEKSEQRTQAQVQAQSQINLAEVVNMVHNHISDSIIISQIRSSGSVFHLSSQDVVTLKQNGVSDVVVQEMLATGHRPPRHYYSRDPVYMVEPAPPPISMGFGYTRYGGRCYR